MNLPPMHTEFPEGSGRPDRTLPAGAGAVAQRAGPGTPAPGAVAPGQTQGRRSQCGQEPVSGQHEPRHPHAHERHSGLLRLLQSTELTARQLDYISNTESAARSLLGLINDILDFSKVEAGKMVLDPSLSGWTGCCATCRWCCR